MIRCIKWYVMFDEKQRQPVVITNTSTDYYFRYYTNKDLLKKSIQAYLISLSFTLRLILLALATIFSIDFSPASCTPFSLSKCLLRVACRLAAVLPSFAQLNSRLHTTHLK